MSEMHIAIDARTSPGAAGGVLQVVLGLAHGLSQLPPGNDHFSFLVNADYNGWLDEHIGDNGRIFRVKKAGGVLTSMQKLVTRAGLVPPGIPMSDEAFERQGFDGVHLLLPIGFRTRVPSVYQIHDLQHLHFPEYFQRGTLRLRATVFPALCHQAQRIFTMTQWGKRDAVDRLGLPADKIAVVPWGSVLSAYHAPSQATLERVKNELSLHEPFAFFPAKTYPHKNHARLLQAAARARDEWNVRIPLVFSGADGAAQATIEAETDRLRLNDQVRHVGYVDADVVASLFRLCRCLVFPSLFEGWGLPITEALSLKKPIACASATCLPEVAQDAAVYFDPYDVASMAQALVQVWADDEIRRRVQDRAPRVAAHLTWKSTARQFHTHYQELFGQSDRCHEAA